MSTTIKNNRLLAAALSYAELGYRVFPCVPGTKVPLTEHGFLDATTDKKQIERWWTEYPVANIGIATAGLAVLDIDGAKNGWLADDPDKATSLAAAPMSITPRGGSHRIFRQPEGKQWRCTEGKIAQMVDTRCDGGYIIAPPSVLNGDRSYRWAEGLKLDDPPTSLPEPPDWLATELDKLTNGTGTDPQHRSVSAGIADSVAHQVPEGQRNATLASLAGTMRRVGMSKSEIFASLERVNVERCVPPLDRREVERIATSVARYEPDQVAVAVTENHWEQDRQATNAGNPEAVDPGPLPADLLRIPGFVSEVMDYTLETAPYPNLIMAFCGALSLQAFLAGRKVRDTGDNRTNLYLLGLAHSAAGKDWPRKINTLILHQLGESGCLGDRFASGEGIQDALYTKPCMFFQTDEIDGMLQSINKSKDARYENVMGTLLTMYSAANSVFPMRRKAGKGPPGAIDQPCLVIFGTAIPNHYYEALSDRMLTNGFFARMIILESGPRGRGQEPSIIELPARVIETARWWSEFRPGTGNLDDWHPVPTVVEYTQAAQKIVIEVRRQAETEYSAAEANGDVVGTTVWGRVNEQVRKLALLYAVSDIHRSPGIDEQAARWATQFVIHQTHRMLFMVNNHAADNPFHASCLKIMRKLREAPERTLSHSVLLKRMKVEARKFGEIVSTLVQRGDIVIVENRTAGRTGRAYRLLEE